MDKIIKELRELRDLISRCREHGNGAINLPAHDACVVAEDVDNLIIAAEEFQKTVSKADDLEQRLADCIQSDTTCLMQFFTFEHLPTSLKAVSRNFALQACEVFVNFPPSAERTAGLRKLLEAKDCVVRCAVVEMNKKG